MFMDDMFTNAAIEIYNTIQYCGAGEKVNSSVKNLMRAAASVSYVVAYACIFRIRIACAVPWDGNLFTCSHKYSYSNMCLWRNHRGQSYCFSI